MHWYQCLCVIAFQILLAQCQSPGNHAANIPIQIEKQRQIEKIKNEIMEKLRSNGATLSKNNIGSVELMADTYTSVTNHKKVPKSDTIAPVGDRDRTTSSPILVIGKPASPRKDRCLLFTYDDASKFIVPFRMSLWVHIRITRTKPKRRKDKVSRESENTGSVSHIVKRSTDGHTKRDKKKNNSKRRKDKNRRRKRGRRIKIFVSNGNKTFVQMRMRVPKTKWYKIELPISQFPNVIQANDTFKLCFKCKRCNKKVKLDLYRKQPSKRADKRHKQDKSDKQEKPTIPFIHFEVRSQLPHAINRNKRSSDVVGVTSHLRHHHSDHKNVSDNVVLSKRCCRREVYTEKISDSFPRILYPDTINITLCDAPVMSPNPVRHLSKHRSNILYNAHTQYKCEPHSYENFSFTFLDDNYQIRRGVIENLIPNSCKCSLIKTPQQNGESNV